MKSEKPQSAARPEIEKPTNVLRILIADAHPFLRAGVAQLLGSDPSVTLEQAGSMSRLREALITSPPNLLIIDVELSGGSTLELIAELRQLDPEMKILVLSGQPERTAGVKAILAGAHGFISKTAGPEQFREAVESVSQGAHYIGRELEAILNEERRRGPRAGKQPHETFSPRENTVMLRISRGLTTAEIAAQLGLNPRTVGAYRARILQKLRIQSTAELTRYVVLKGLDKE